MNHWLKAARDLWALAVFWYRIFIAPWPPFTVVMVVIALVAVATPIIIVRATSGLIEAITRGIEAGSIETAAAIDLLTPILPWLALLFAVRAVESVLQIDPVLRYMGQKLGLRSMKRLEDLLYGKATSLRLDWFEHPRYYDGLQRAVEIMDEQEQSRALTQAQNVVLVAFQTLGVLVAFAAIHWSVPLAMAVVSVFLLLSHGIQAKREVDINRAQTAARRREEYLSRLLTERAPASEVRLFGLAEYVIASWRKKANSMLKEKAELRLKNLSLGIPSSLASVCLLGIVLVSLVWAGHQGTITAGAVVGYIYITWSYTSRVSVLLWRTRSLHKFASGMQYLPEFLSLGRIDRRGGVEAPSRIRQGVSLHKVSFTYPGGTSPVLSEIDVELRAGETVALIGENGAGKTTLTKLLLGLYEPVSGSVSVDDMDLKQINLTSWRKRTGAVFQDYMKYAFTARENIGMGRIAELENMDAIRGAAVRSGVHSAIEELPQGYETLLGREFEGGRELSGGQWQSLAIARLYLRDADILVLDEPTSALDPLAEVQVYHQFLELSRNKTVLLISHRLGSARLADRVLFLKDGRIIEEGTHDELVKAGGAYSELFAMQAEWYR